MLIYTQYSILYTQLLKFFFLNILYFVMYKMAIQSKIKSHSDVINYFKDFPFYNKSIERPVKRLKNIDPSVELPLYEQLSVIKTDQAFEGFVMSYKVEIIEKKIQLYN